MKNIFHPDFTWKKLWSTIFGLALAILIFFGAFLLPAFLESMIRLEFEDLKGAYTVYTGISAILLGMAIRLNLWFSNKSTFVRDALAIAIGANCMIWGFTFINYL